MSFLKTEWRKLAIANYAVDPSAISKYVPHGTEIDLWQDKCYVSLVGLMFLNTKLLGIKIPFHVHFEEVNLRFYVKRNENNRWKRGVVFIKEIVPKRAITFVANSIYNENYETLPMQHRWDETSNSRSVEYRWKKGGEWQHFAIKAEVASSLIQPNSETEFITEHYWGYAKADERTTNEYEVIHPKWRSYEVLNYTVDVDFEVVYGSEFKFLNAMKPTSVMLAEGSEVKVEQKRVIEAK